MRRTLRAVCGSRTTAGLVRVGALALFVGAAYLVFAVSVVVLVVKHARLAAAATYAGIPAQRIDLHQQEHFHDGSDDGIRAACRSGAAI